MRLIGSVYTPQAVALLVQRLEHNNIPHTIEMQVVTDWGSASYGDRSWLVWILNEEDLPRAQQLYEQLMQEHDPLAPLTSIQPPSIDIDTSNLAERKPGLDTAPLKWITGFLLFFCIACFVGSFLLTNPSHRGELFATPLIPTDPIKRTFLYDFPKQYALINELLEKANLLSTPSQEELQKALMKLQNTPLAHQIEQTPVWPGFYSIFLSWLKKEPNWKEQLAIPRFEKIHEGEFWRLITPIFLHQNLIHILFNLLWVYLLGRQLESGLGPWRYIGFCLIVAAVSNTAQYLMTGSNFLGISGLVCGMITYIYLRSQQENVEGYFLAPGAFASLAIFVGVLTGIQFISFLFEATSNGSFPISIANTAHITGALCGALLSRYPTYPKEERILA